MLFVIPTSGNKNATTEISYEKKNKTLQQVKLIIYLFSEARCFLCSFWRTVVLGCWESKTPKFGIKPVEKGQISTV